MKVKWKSTNYSIPQFFADLLGQGYKTSKDKAANPKQIWHRMNKMHGKVVIGAEGLQSVEKLTRLK